MPTLNATPNATRKTFLLIRAFPPSVNSMYLPGKRNGTRILSRNYVEFLKAANADWAASNRPRVPAGYYRVRLYFFPQDRRWFDLDNRIKATLDALNKTGFWNDDRFVRTLEAVRGEPVEGGAVAIVVESFPEYESRDPRELGLTPYRTRKEKTKKGKRK